VVPTFNRGPALAETIRRLTASELGAGDELEILVVDDGSAVPARDTVASSVAAAVSPWVVRWLRQPNGGPAAARNAGFRASGGDLILFVDDDILVPPDLVRAHVDAHRQRPGSAIFGLCPFTPDAERRPFRAFLQRCLDPPVMSSEGLVEVPIVASGQISVERHQFADDGGVYSPEMTTPAAEEYELTFRLRRRGIPILAAPWIVALHDQPVDVASYCRQQFKHGRGCGEAAARRPEILEVEELARIIDSTGPGPAGEGPVPRRVLKGLASTTAVRSTLSGMAKVLERVPVPSRLLFAAYRAAIAAHFIAGVRDGHSRFGGVRDAR
jgi:GT2 family glycosyltransferase